MTNTPLSRTLAEAANLISNEDYQTRERDRQMANTGKLGSSLDSKEKASKKVYGKDGKVDSKNLKAFLKKANSPKNEDIEEAAKASPQEDEFLTDLTNAQIAAIKPLMKSKNWDKLKAYLMSQKIVDKNFEDIQGYKMDRDVLSVLQRSFMDYHEQVENVEEQRYIKEYIELLESALESIAEEIGCSVEDLLVEIQTPQRTRQLRSIIDKAERSKKPGGIGTPEYSDKQYNSTKSGAKKLLGYRKAEEDEKRAIKLFNKEVGSKKLYGKGGQVIKRKIRPNSDTTNG